MMSSLTGARVTICYELTQSIRQLIVLSFDNEHTTGAWVITVPLAAAPYVTLAPCTCLPANPHNRPASLSAASAMRTACSKRTACSRTGSLPALCTVRLRDSKPCQSALQRRTGVARRIRNPLPSGTEGGKHLPLGGTEGGKHGRSSIQIFRPFGRRL